MTEERAFNQPVSMSGKAIFAIINWLERQIISTSKVGATPFFSEDKFPWTEKLKAQWQAVAKEADALLDTREALPAFQDISKEVGYISKDQDWKTFMLMGYGFRAEKNLAHCPATAKVLETIPDIRTAFFSILEPGKALPPHRGPYNGVLRLHLGLIIPKQPEKCWIRVADQHHYWLPGEVLIFDDALEHEVHNDTDEVRVILFIDFIRPCRWPISWLNRLLIFLARYSPLITDAQKNYQRWEKGYYQDK